MTIYPAPKAPKKPRTSAAKDREEYARTFHSVERSEFVKARPCIVCRKSPCDNHHIKSEGKSRKGHYTKIVPVCNPHHREYHAIGKATFIRKYPWVNLETEAAKCEAAWQSHLDTTQENQITTERTA